MKFPPSFIEQLRLQAPISEILGRRLALRRHGREYHALCPFHKEKSPSFTVNDEKGFYHCFGCGAHGDAINFIKEYEGVGYKEAVEKLAGEVGLALPQLTPQAQERARQIDSLHDVMEAACQWFEEQLHTSNGDVARRYIAGRALSQDTQQEFRIGYSGGARDALKQHLLKKGVSEKQLIECGLVIKLEDGSPSYDRFRQRLMFPIRDRAGQVVAFGGRLLEQGDGRTPKYLNSPETPLFKKGELLYNIDKARKPAQLSGTLIIAEGYMDVIALSQAGMGYAVAPLGTAVTEQQLALAWRLAGEPVMCLDGDAAGSRAMARAAELALPLLKPGFSLKFALLPPKDDPDSLLRRHGVTAMKEIVQAARPLSRTLWEMQNQAAGSTPERKAALETSLMQLAERIKDTTVRNYYKSYFRKKLWGEYEPNKKGKKTVQQVTAPPVLGAGNTQLALQQSERLLLKLLLLHPALLLRGEVEENIARMDFIDAELDKLRQAILEHLSTAEHIDRESLEKHLASQGLVEVSKGLLHNETIALPKIILGQEPLDDATLPFAVWKQIITSHVLAGMELEYQQLAAEMAAHMDDETYNRFLALKKQIETTRKTRDYNVPGERVVK